jgi:hypothetical protein
LLRAFYGGWSDERVNSGLLQDLFRKCKEKKRKEETMQLRRPALSLGHVNILGKLSSCDIIDLSSSLDRDLSCPVYV